MTSTASDTSLLNGMEQQFDNAGAGNTGSDVLSDVNASALLDAEVNTLSEQGYTVSVDTTDQPTVDAGPFSMPLYDWQDDVVATQGGSLTAAADNVTESGVIAGKIAATAALVEDSNMAPLNAHNYAGISVDRMLGVLILDEAKQDYSQMVVKEQDEANPQAAHAATRYIEFSNGGTVAQSSAALQAAAATASMQAAENSFASSTFSTTEGQSDLAQVIAAASASSGPSNQAGIDLTHVTSATATTNAGGNALIGTVVTTVANGVEFTYTTAYSTTVPAESTVVVATGSNAQLTATGTAFSVNGNDNFVSDSQAAAITLDGAGNTLVSTVSGGLVEVEGSGALLVLNGGATHVVGAGSGTRLFNGSGSLDYSAPPGTLVLGSGSATIAGSDTVFGGTGTIAYQGAGGTGDVIGGASGHDTISAAQNGWFAGGSQGMNLIVGSNSGQGTVLQAGGAGDHLIGGTQGGDYFLAGAGNETLTGGNAAGTQAIFGGTGQDLVQLGSANAIINTSTGAMSITGAGTSAIYEATNGGALTLNASGGTQDVHGFRVGTDHVNLSGGGWTEVQSGGSTILSSAHTGTVYRLEGVSAGLGSLG